uniref:MATH domain-containing protein n=1 Tax=Aegilops tauschii TaxID=37682 RepID=M8CCM7_AEGTA
MAGAGSSSSGQAEGRQNIIRLQFELSFIDEVEKQDPAHIRTRQVIDLISSNYGVGYHKFIALEALENSKHLKEDRFTIRCDVLVTERLAAQRCAGCNLRPASVAVQPAPHVCFCDVCHDASHDDPSAKQCAGCHGPFTAILLAFSRLPYGHLELD